MIERDRDQRVAAFEEWLHSDKNPGTAGRLILDIAFTAGWRAAKVKKMPTTSKPKSPFAVVVAGTSRYADARAASPTRWQVFPVGRESATRLYALPTKPESRWASDPYKTTATDVLARFDTEAEAKAFIDAGMAALAEPIAAAETAEEASKKATEEASAARIALRHAVIAFWAART